MLTAGADVFGLKPNVADFSNFVTKDPCVFSFMYSIQETTARITTISIQFFIQQPVFYVRVLEPIVLLLRLHVISLTN